MSVLQLKELVSYQLRTSYLDEIADGVGERLLTVNDNFLNSASFKAAGWRPNPSHIKRTHSPPIPTAIASEYFQAPRQVGLTLHDGDDDGGMLTGGGADTIGPGMATKRRRRREQMEEDDSSDLTDESDEENEQRAAQQIKFSKMPVRQRAGSSPSQASPVKLQSQSPRAPRRGSQSVLETVRERPRGDTVTSSEISSENEFDVPAAHRHREAARAAARAVRLQEAINEEPMQPGIKRVGTNLLPEEEDDDEADDDDDSDEDEDDLIAQYVESLNSALILDGMVNLISPSLTEPVIGTPPRIFARQSMRMSQLPVQMGPLDALPPPRPMSMIRPMSMMHPTSLLSTALKAKKHKASIPFQNFAHYSGKGTQGSIAVRIYAPFSKTPTKPFEALIRPRVHDGQGAERAVTVTDLIGLSLYRYNEEKREPQIASDKHSLNWWTLRMVEEGGEVDDDFPPIERTKPLSSFTTVNNASARGGGRMRSNSTAYDEFALVPASQDEFEENKNLTPQPDDDEQDGAAAAATATTTSEQQKQEESGADNRGEDSGRRSPIMVDSDGYRLNPILTTIYRPNTMLADSPQIPVTVPNIARGQQKLLRVHIMSSDMAPGQMVTVDVTTATYLAEVLDIVCRKRQLDKANHVLKLPRSGAVVMIDRPVSSIGNVSDLELYRRRFATDGPFSMTGSSPSSLSPKTMGLPSSQGVAQRRDNKKSQVLGPHPLAREALKQDEDLGVSANYKKYTVWRKQPMRLVGMSERILVIDGEYIHIVPASGGKAVHDGSGKTTTVHFSNVVGCKVPRKHPTNVKLVIYRATESKRYDFETRSADEAAEIVAALKRGISPRDV
ncbi:related to stress activated MAP kinase interacting protein [Claviceps purpurea 20.1]|uniref:Related to stress activated MAP kinase interacting protein n=1 Tax=Claviceps purpurea (strain 20.1) TaxID=1111077 RepID=M1W915_CLAP2|nr:hypothetical protein E4U27_006797 [Claviceps purpurea]CCE32220.1 related to stress activated MAP kinase interacting protein [Claviceps purpurea 20.1]KAG6208773.1 hypothetical protein E4U50_003225 [Claviceps purpurea]KAG6226379.1 hypothetical protein E4U26_002462 [Claviceps purpurea]KAG6241752.1 hypothetical protein E4U25_005570 [Claviceps purpurea]